MGAVEQIAEEVGVSTHTVMRVLRGQNKEVWPSTARRASQIRDIAQRLGYLPDSSARAMRSGRYNTIALLLSVDRGRSYLPDDLFSGISSALHAQSMRLIVSQMADEELTSSQVVPVILREWSCDGLLLNYTNLVPAQMEALIVQCRIPSIWINRRQRTDAVYYDDLGGAAAATRHLISLGHRRITYLDFQPREKWATTHYSRADRYEGYARTMREAELAATPREQYAGVAPAERLKVLCGLLRGRQRPTAIISFNSGLRILQAASLVGLQVPKDLSVLRFHVQSAYHPDDGSDDQTLGSVLSGMSIPAEVAGREAAEMLLKKIEAPDKAIKSIVLPLEFEPGETCGPAPANGGECRVA